MLNLISGELYKLKKNKGLKVCCIVLVSAILALYLMLYTADLIQTGEVSNNTNVVLTVDEELAGTQGGSIFDELGYADMFQQIVSSFCMILAVIASTLFVIGDYTSGAMKNLVGKGMARTSIFLSKYLVSSVAAAAMILLGSLATMFFGFFFIGFDALTAAVVKDYVIYTLLEMILAVALNGIAITISQISRSMGVAISLGICMVSFSSLIFSGLDLVLRKFQVKASDYWMVDLMGACPVSGFEREIVIRIIVTGIVWFAAAFAAGVLHFNKTDVK